MNDSTRRIRVRVWSGKICRCGGGKEGRSKYCNPCKIANARMPEDPNVYVVDGIECRRLPLTQEQYSLVNAERYDCLISRSYFSQWSENGKCFYARRWVILSDGTRVTIRMQNDILGIPPGEIVDHKNHDTLDNRDANLRPASHSLNGANNRQSKSNTSGHKGIYPVRGKWRAIITKDRNRIHIGYFDTFNQAATAWEAKAIELFGEFACWSKI